MSHASRLALIVEDSAEFEHLVREALHSLGSPWDCVCARNGAEALAMLEAGEQRPDLVLVDLGLPDMSGVAVIRAARRWIPRAPIMVISVLSSSDNVLAAIRAGARGYLHKGDSALSLSRAIERVMAGEHPISASLAHYLFNLVRAPDTEGETIGLSPREVQLLRLLSQGYTAEEAAEQMSVGVSTVHTYCRRIYQKLQVNSKVKAILAARELGWI